MKNDNILTDLALFVCSVCVGLFIAEAAIRAAGHYDVNGNFFLWKLRLKPYVLNMDNILNSIRKYESSEKSYLLYDPELGWSSRPHGSSENGLYSANGDSIRMPSANMAVSKDPRPGVLRISVFGDSFTHGDEVRFEDTWGNRLENNMKALGIDTEILNFGMAGYGMDQALLRWRKDGRSFSPDIVIFGLCTENMGRNLNLIRPVYRCQGGVPFSKPRFIIAENGGLKIVNVPAVPPGELIRIIKDPGSWDPMKHERWFDERDYTNSFLRKSRLFALIERFVDKAMQSLKMFKDKNNIAVTDDESIRLAVKIIREFRDDARSKGSEFYVVFLPSRNEIMAPAGGRDLFCGKLLEYLEKDVKVIHAEYGMRRQADISGVESLFQGHYNALGNRCVADAITEHIIKDRGL